jgi:hypothetical protein
VEQKAKGEVFLVVLVVAIAALASRFLLQVVIRSAKIFLFVMISTAAFSVFWTSTQSSVDKSVLMLLSSMLLFVAVVVLMILIFLNTVVLHNCLCCCSAVRFLICEQIAV